ncbi:MAG: hypothetical protein JJT76_09030 [Clostridiaceae bacterium]|nr:hypothetical protein [Clostridiaceae bacterium]
MEKIILVVIVALIGVGVFIYNQIKYVTYEEVVSRSIANETIEKVHIKSTRTDCEFETKAIGWCM